MAAERGGQNALRFLGALVATNLKASYALRASFWVQVGFMLVNNLIFFVMWWIFFGAFEEVRGWRLEDMAAVYAVGAGGFGLSVVFGEGARHLARMIQEGELDAFLVQPKPVLMQCVASRSWASGWGDVLTASILLGLSGYTSPFSVGMLVVACLCAGAVFLATTVLVQCSAFWIDHVEELAKQASEFVLLFAFYPRTIFDGVLKLVLFTVVPAGFITFVPVDLVRDFSWGVLALSVGGAAFYAGLAALVFRAGLRRYASGNRFTVRA